MTTRLTVLVLGCALLSLTPTAAQTNWPQFRGEMAGVVEDDPGLPESWSTDQNVEWQIDVPGRGWWRP